MTDAKASELPLRALWADTEMIAYGLEYVQSALSRDADHQTLYVPASALRALIEQYGMHGVCVKAIEQLLASFERPAEDGK